MFKKGDYIVYGNSGICEIADITTINMEGVPKDKLYYVLYPYNQIGRKVFIPVNSLKVSMRKIMTEKEATALIEEIPNIEQFNIINDKLCEGIYKECIRSGKCKEWIRMIKTLYLRKQERISKGKKFPTMEEKYWKMVEENLYSELSIALGIPKNQMEQYITEKLVC